VSLKALRATHREEGQGLRIVDGVSDTWSIESDPCGTEIKASLSDEATDDARRRPVIRPARGRTRCPGCRRFD